MGCDIHTWIEVKDPKTNNWSYKDCDTQYGEYKETPFGWRAYSTFAFFNNVRNYSKVPEQVWWYRGFPKYGEYDAPPADLNYSTDDYDWFGLGHIYLNELLDFDYEQTLIDLRGEGNNTLTEGKTMTYRVFLGESFFEELAALKEIFPDPQNVRIVFCFNN